MRRLLALLLLSCVALTGCSGSKKAASPTPVPAPTPSVTASPTPGPTAPAASPTRSRTPSPGRTTTAPQDPLSPRPPIESPAPVGQPTCRAAALSVVDADAVTTETAVQEVFLVRTKGGACQLAGYPRVQLLGTNGKALTLRINRSGYGLKPGRIQPVTLTSQTTVSFVVATARKGSCLGTTALRVTLPGTSSALRAPTGLRVCGGAVGLSPVQRNLDQD